MKVLITGGAGFIGSRTTQKLIDEGHETVVLDDLSTGFKKSAPSGAHFIEGNVRDGDLLFNIIQKYSIESVVHFAGKLVISESLQQPTEYFGINTRGSLELAKACAKSKVRNLLFSSTGAVYGEGRISGIVSEETIPQPICPYGSSKLMAENIFKKFDEQFGIKTVILRYFNAAGAAMDGTNGQRTAKATHLIHLASQAACGKRSSVNIYGTDFPTPDGTGVRDYIHVDDLADLHVRALSYLQDGGPSDVFNCGYGRGYSVREILKTMQKVSGRQFEIKEMGRRPGDAATRIADASKIRKAFDWTPKWDDIDLICKSAYEWEKTQG